MKNSDDNSPWRPDPDALEGVLDRYRAVVSRVDAAVSQLVGLHRSRMKCGLGCAACCTRVSVLPVEWYTVRMAIDGRANINASPSSIKSAPPSSPCGFLRDGACSIYGYRPLLCRVHGLPLRYPILSYDDTGVVTGGADTANTDGSEGEEASSTVWCDLNFTGRDSRVFADGEFFDMTALNTELNELNTAFLHTPVGRRFADKPDVFLCDDSI